MNLKAYFDNILVGNEISIPNNSINIRAIIGTSGTGDNVLLNNGTFNKVNNNVITDNTINGSKIVDASTSTSKIIGISPGNSGTNYLNDKGQFINVSGFNNAFSNNVNANNYKINNLSDPVNLQDAATKNWIQNIVFQSINTYLSNNSIQIQKLLFTGDGTKALFDDGTFKTINTSSDLYLFTSFTFTKASAIGRFGPTLSQCQTSYSSESWTQNTNYLNMLIQGIQLWTVPKTASYRISAQGAMGSGSGAYSGGYGGNGARITGTFNLNKNDVICIVVGQKGIFGPNSGGGGGGGSFVYKNSDNSILLIAGGGGGGGHDIGYGGYGSNNQYPVNGGGSGNGGYNSLGYGGNGGTYSSGYMNEDWNDAAGGGGGWYGNGMNGIIIGTSDNVGYGGKGKSGNFEGGYFGSFTSTGNSGNGGFGGGGGSGGNGNSGGGAGGYTGGGGGNIWPGVGNPGHGGGQGGGSYNNGLNQVNDPNFNSNDGSILITLL